MMKFPFTKVIFPATLPGESSTITATAYKSNIGRTSDFDVEPTKHFTFKVPEGSSFVNTISNSNVFKNGFVAELASGDLVFDFVEDATHIYAVFSIESSSTYDLKLYKLAKTELLTLTQTYTSVTLLSGGATRTAVPANYNRMMCQNSDYVFVAFHDADNSLLVQKKIKKSDLSISSLTSSTASFDTVEVFDVCCDLTTLFVGIRTLAGATVRGFVVTSNIDGVFTSGDTFVMTTSIPGYDVSALSVLDEHCVAVTGFTASEVHSNIIRRNASSFVLESQSILMTGHASNTSNFVSTSSDRAYNNSKVFARVYEGTQHRLKKLFYGKGIKCDSGRNPVITLDMEINNAYDLNIVTTFNYGNVGGNSQDVFLLTDDYNEFKIFIDASSNIIVQYNGVEMARAFAQQFKADYTTAQPYQTISLTVTRTAGVFTFDINGQGCSVIHNPLQKTQVINIVQVEKTYIGLDACDEGFVYRSLYANFGGTIIIDDDYSFGKIPAGSDAFISVDALYDLYENVDALYSKRIEAKNGDIYCDASPDTTHIKIAKYKYDLTIARSVSPDLDEYASTNDSVIRVVGSDDGFVYFLSGMDSAVSGYRTYNISRMLVVNPYGVDSFSFACNAKTIEFKYSPVSAGIETDNLTIVDVEGYNEQLLPLIGPSYTADSTYTTKSAIIKMGEGHTDFLRMKAAPSVVSIDLYSKAEAGYAGTKYVYDSYSASFTASTSGDHKKTTVSYNIQDTGEVYESWLDTVNMYFDPEGALLKNAPIAVVAIMGVSAFKAELYFTLDSNYNMNSESNLVSLGDPNDTGLITNTLPCVSSRKQVEVIEMIGLDNRNARSIKFRIAAETTNAKYDDFKIFELRYSPSDSFFIGGDNEG